MRRAKRGWSSKLLSLEFGRVQWQVFPRRKAPGRTDKANDDVNEETRCQPVQPEGSGSGHQRVTKVVKGGKNMSFAALVVVGDAASGVVGYGSGKAKEVPQAIRKELRAPRKNLVRVHLTETTIPHQVLGRFGSGQVLLKPAPKAQA